MSFTSFSFLVFITAVFFAYYLAPMRARWVVLLAASLFFYWKCSRLLIGWLVFTALTVYAAALLLQRLNEAGAAAAKACAGDRARQTQLRQAYQRKKKWAAAAVLSVNFLLLALTKYLPLLQRAANALGALAGAQPLTFSRLAMPLGISFYTFQSAGYVIDVYRGRQQAERNPLKLLLFLSFFPQIMQGPISRFGQLAPQLFAGSRFSFDRAERGIVRIGWGFVKKLLLADRLSVPVAAVFSESGRYGGAVMFAASVLYGLQIYADFSGGIDVTLGVADVLGVEVTPNFRQPYFAVSLSDFWRRWHISLGAWMRDYLFYPAAMSRPLTRLGKWVRARWGMQWNKVVVSGLVSFLVFTAVGVWHGPELKYVAYGLYNGAIIMLSTMCEPLFDRFFAASGIDRRGRPWHAFQIARTFVLVTLGRCIVRSPSVRVALRALWRMVSQPRWGQLGVFASLGLGRADFVIIGLVLALLAAADGIAEFAGPPFAWLKKRPIAVRWLVYYGIIFMLLLLTPVEEIGGEFIYAGF